MTTSVWKPYRPSASAPWNRLRTWTLHRRAGFGATWSELERDLADGPDAAVGRVLAGKCRMDGVPPEFAATADLLGDAAASAEDGGRLQAWWLYRMMFTPDPLAERLCLLWHNHFATSQLKVENATAMRGQNETLRRLGRGPFGDLLRAMLNDPALLIWLDAGSNRKGKPNENLARELMELFTLGIGNYTESDVKEAARALTGRVVVQGRAESRADRHDNGNKTILGQTGPFDGDALAGILLDQPSTANRLAGRLCGAFLGEGVANQGAVQELAVLLKRDQLHIGRAVERILRSELFFSGRNLKSQVMDPVGFVVGSLRGLESFDPPPSTLLVAEWTIRMGQALFFPPNVGGWPGGRSWLSGREIVARANFAAAVVEGRLSAGSSSGMADLRAIAAKHRRGRDDAEALGFCGDLLLGQGLDTAVYATILRECSAGGGTAAQRFGRTVANLLARPEAQLT